MMEGSEEEEDLVVGHFETGRTTVTVRDIAVSEKQPLCHRGRVARRWRAIARILFPDHQTVVRRRRRRDGSILGGGGIGQVVAIVLLLHIPNLASARPGSDATAASGGN